MIGVLNAYLFDEENHPFQKEYTPICRDFLQQNFPQEVIFFYDIAKGVWPETTSDCRAWVITGSAKSAYDTDPWIAKLKDFVKDCHRDGAPVIGICFGHQIIAEALGGKVEKSDKGWGVGVRPFNIVAKETPKWMTPQKNEVSLLFSHQDQVTELPPGAKLLASDDFCPNQVFQLGKNILSVQGHPEFTPHFSGMRLDMTQERLPKEVYRQAKESLSHKTNADDFGKWFQEFLKDYL